MKEKVVLPEVTDEEKRLRALARRAIALAETLVDEEVPLSEGARLNVDPDDPELFGIDLGETERTSLQVSRSGRVVVLRRGGTTERTSLTGAEALEALQGLVGTLERRASVAEERRLEEAARRRRTEAAKVNLEVRLRNRSGR